MWTRNYVLRLAVVSLLAWFMFSDELVNRASTEAVGAGDVTNYEKCADSVHTKPDVSVSTEGDVSVSTGDVSVSTEGDVSLSMEPGVSVSSEDYASMSSRVVSVFSDSDVTVASEDYVKVSSKGDVNRLSMFGGNTEVPETSTQHADNCCCAEYLWKNIQVKPWKYPVSHKFKKPWILQKPGKFSSSRNFWTGTYSEDELPIVVQKLMSHNECKMLCRLREYNIPGVPVIMGTVPAESGYPEALILSHYEGKPFSELSKYISKKFYCTLAVHHVCSTLCELHEKNIVHGSVNPSNVIISIDQRRVKTTLVDYSRCRQVEPDDQQELEKDIEPLVHMINTILPGKKKLTMQQIRRQTNETIVTIHSMFKVTELLKKTAESVLKIDVDDDICLAVRD
ncbi:hypothetical protein OTU49_012413 [Cherax quadricarinatus]|uniref:Protein kinase domain-containing protein n=1 Tax=Cherax quadricarinatus TaxID=27406 RepID=A0AAW0VXZ5_CHEQU